MKAYTKAETILMMLIEAKNELTKNEIVERMSARIQITNPSGNNLQMLGKVQASSRILKSTITTLEEFLQEETKNQELDKVVDKSFATPPQSAKVEK